MTNKIQINSVLTYDRRAIFFWISAGICIMSLFVYIYAVNSISRNIATRQSLERQAGIISTNLDALEFSYIELQNNVTIELAHNYGFKEVDKPLYVSRTNPETSLSFNTINR